VTIHSYVGSNTTIKGNLECSENFLVEGAVEGNLNSRGTIVLGKDSVVRGEVRAREVAVSGIVVGTIRCSNRLEIFQSAKIIGTIQAPVMKMEPGALVNGRVLMSRKNEEVELIPHSPEEMSSAADKPHR
jgi:cytoskeletal protein CcmA (bactofilin family)